jgi:hypothetical protein
MDGVGGGGTSDALRSFAWNFLLSMLSTQSPILQLYSIERG